ncbi:MAG: ferrochelatase [Nannocystaceae bacterium]
MPAPSPIGVLLVNLGTPDAPEVAEVRRYLAEFLSDPRVLDIHPIGRWLLLHAIILRTRPAKSAAAYRKIWGPEGSPLLLHTRALGAAVADALPDHVIEVAMRYGNPSLRSGLQRLQAAGCDRILVIPLYPHYAASSTGSTVEAIFREAAPLWNTPYLQVMPAFYDHPAFIDALAAVGAPVLAELDAEHVVYSFHGLPERHMRKSDPSGKHCLEGAGCCDRIVPANRNCYRAQCYATARALTGRLGLDPARTTVCFQSRLGRTPWIQPYTDHVLPALAARGIKRVAVFCPAFVADCLETLEEIGIRARDDWKAAGGDELRLVPGLNAEPLWVAGVVRMIRESLGSLPIVG